MRSSISMGSSVLVRARQLRPPARCARPGCASGLTHFFHVSFQTGERGRMMYCFDNLFTDESCMRADSKISLLSLFAGIFSAEARGRQGG